MGTKYENWSFQFHKTFNGVYSIELIGSVGRKDVVFAASNPETSFGSVLDDAVQGVEISKVVTDTRDPEAKYEPNHPHADKNGMVFYPKVNAMEEMVNVLSATRSYEANLQAVNMAKEMQQKTLEILW